MYMKTDDQIDTSIRCTTGRELGSIYRLKVHFTSEDTNDVVDEKSDRSRRGIRKQTNMCIIER